MKTSIPRAARAALLLALAGAWVASAIPAAAPELGPRQHAAAAPSTEVEARVIVKYRADSAMVRALSASSSAAAGTPQQHAQALSNRLGLSLTDGRAIGDRAQVVKGKGLTSAELAARLGAQSDVEYAEVDGRVSVYVNGKESPAQAVIAVPAKKGAKTPAAAVPRRSPFRVMLGDAVKPGENTVAVRCDNRTISELFLGGILRPVLLVEWNAKKE